MPLDFPNSPSIGATYSPAGISKSWIYTGEQWSAITAPIEEGASVTVSDTPPSGASAGDLWFDSSSGITSVYYDNTWIDVGGGDSGTSAGSVNGIVKSDGSGNFSAAVAGTDYLTSASLPTSPASVKAWVYFAPDGTIIDNYNVTSVAQGTSGKYTVNFNPGTFANSNYVFAGSTKDVNDDAIFCSIAQLGTDTSSTNSCTFSTMRSDNGGRQSMPTRVAFFGS
jgi:hypothetical protein